MISLTLIALLALAASTATAAGPKRPRDLVIEARGETVTATTGSYCVSDAYSGMCVDVIYPLAVRGALEVSPGERLTLRTGDERIARVDVSLLRVRGNRVEPTGWTARATRIVDRPSRFRVTLPDDLEGANRLDVFYDYEKRIGDANFWARIR